MTTKAIITSLFITFGLLMLSGCKSPTVQSSADKSKPAATEAAAETSAESVSASQPEVAKAPEVLSLDGDSEEVAFQLTDKQIEGYRMRLLEQAFDFATAIPVKPHIKDRCRYQIKVAQACLELDLPATAHKYGDQILNWRRAAAYGDLARYCAANGNKAEALKAIAVAKAGIASAADWRRDSIKVRIAIARSLMGEAVDHAEVNASVVESEKGKLTVARTDVMDDAAFDSEMESLAELIAIGHFDITRNALNSYTSLYKRFYTDTDRRELLAETIKTSWIKVPPFVRVQLLVSMAQAALDNDDKKTAMSLVEDAQDYLDNADWPLQYDVEMSSLVAQYRAKAGDTERARKDLEAALERYEAGKARIVNIYRAETLCPVAQAYKAMGDNASSLAIYKMAVQAAIENPNSRPRAEDMSAICSSMAVHAVEPDSELWDEITRISEGLGQPW